ncbi:DNA-processing protein DprA [Sphingomonas beigongshangi]|uniref:DNA-processing protein DprA n=1 Tax=Sphingomonas beigongshangi TaxID=2782540 RepID=UPI00193BC46C|nr:DNA-processing protein DprA [Sphingomonas beigongshangi]
MADDAGGQRRSARSVPAAGASAGRSGRYVPPSDVHAYPLTGLLEAIGRNTFAERQMSMLNAVADTDEAGAARVFYAGNIHLLEGRCIAVIGARKATEMGRRRARQLGRQLAQAGVVVVSGLAEGIDTEALSGAMEAGGKVVAVIGTPIDQAYPAKNKALQEAIYRDHLLISQFPIGARVFPSNFPARNRTMAAISDASVVIEASDTSGTLHQAAECQKLGRWLVIAKSVKDDPALTWPAKFIGKPMTTILESTPQLLATIYGE